MSPNHGDIQSLKMAIMAEARQDAAKILADARSKTEGVERQAQEQVEAQREAILRQARQKAGTLHDQAVTSAQLEAQALKLQRREELLARVFVAARRKLASVLEWPDYAQIARQLIREAVENLGAESLLILADEKTRGIFDEGAISDLERELGVHLDLGDPLERGTGVVLVTADGHRRYDNTLETRLSRMQSSLRTSVYRILTEGTL